ncbi:hypothetical protein Cgig2_029988 [Carnegiea gigantea]|uniref:Uncharacterized protein n=1 Tax=Carnegiea gigantea TaxID=171969 RepID=A0A9Q1K7B4_9CARY|nr:hypothetical protein Cgig2_029988 [Carnegiea gigantea]
MHTPNLMFPVRVQMLDTSLILTRDIDDKATEQLEKPVDTATFDPSNLGLMSCPKGYSLDCATPVSQDRGAHVMELQAEMANKKRELRAERADEVSWSKRLCPEPNLFESEAVGNAGLQRLDSDDSHMWVSSSNLEMMTWWIGLKSAEDGDCSHFTKSPTFSVVGKYEDSGVVYKLSGLVQDDALRELFVISLDLLAQPLSTRQKGKKSRGKTSRLQCRKRPRQKSNESNLVLTMELRKCCRSLQNEVTYVIDSSSSSDDDSNHFDALEEDGNNSTNSPLVLLKAKASGNSKDENAREIF